MPAPVTKGQELLIPFYNAESMTPVTVKWSQNLSSRTAQYYPLCVDNLTSGEQVPFFIAVELLKSITINNPMHISKIGEKLEGDGYKITVNDKLQYGQKNAQGELRFVVYHDKERKPYQHRFMETALGSMATGKAKEMAGAFGVSGTVDTVTDLAKSFVGDYLHTF